MSEKRRGLGRGIGALIPSGPTTATVARPVDVFFPPSSGTAPSAEELARDGANASDDAQRTPSKAQAAAQSLMAPSKAARSRSASAQAHRKTSGKSSSSPAPSGDAPEAGTAGRDPAATKRVAASRKQDSASRKQDSAGRKQEVDDAGRTAAPAAAAASGPAGGAGQAAVRAPEQDAGLPTTGANQAAADSDLVPVPGAQFAELLVQQIVPNTRQPRQVFDEDDLDELAASIREVGVLQPVVVRQLAEPEGPDGPQYELIMGERRWRASQLAGNDTVPAIIRDTTDGDLLRDALLENLHRADLNPLEEAAAYQQLLEDFGCTHDELAGRIARSRPQISNTLRLLKLPPLVQRRVAAGVLSAGHARALLGLSDGAAMERLAQKIVAEGLSVRATEEIVALGDEPVAPEMRRRPRTSVHAEHLNQLATRLADRLDTRVKVNLGQRKGRIAIEFASVEDLNRILDVLAPGEEHIASEN